MTDGSVLGSGGKTTQGSGAPRASASCNEGLRIDPELKHRLNGGPGHMELLHLIVHDVRVTVVPGSVETRGGEEYVLVRRFGEPDGQAVRVNSRFVVTAVDVEDTRKQLADEAAKRARPQVEFVASD